MPHSACSFQGQIWVLLEQTASACTGNRELQTECVPDVMWIPTKSGCEKGLLQMSHMLWEDCFRVGFFTREKQVKI